ncbi:MAG: hypothetical protein E7580_03635 [Ruminococcaceae bacterium]|nr:hypothetical protein [Oscillospiraceae bacterium]
MRKRHLFTSIFQVIVGVAAVIAYIVIAASDESVGRWTITLILAILYIIMGVIGIVDWKRLNS